MSLLYTKVRGSKRRSRLSAYTCIYCLSKMHCLRVFRRINHCPKPSQTITLSHKGDVRGDQIIKRSTLCFIYSFVVKTPLLVLPGTTEYLGHMKFPSSWLPAQVVLHYVELPEAQSNHKWHRGTSYLDHSRKVENAYQLLHLHAGTKA